MSNPVLVIAGSVRARRIAPEIANWIARIGALGSARPFEVVDLAEWNLPMDDEPAIPKNGPYEHEHTRAWARKIDAAAGFVFVTPQYNGGYPAALKNAIDHLYAEWTGKPALIVTYGGHGGAHCGEQLDVVCRFVKLRPIDPRPALTLPHEVIVNNTGEIDPDTVFAAQVSDVEKALAELERALSMPAAQLS